MIFGFEKKFTFTKLFNNEIAYYKKNLVMWHILQRYII